MAVEETAARARLAAHWQLTEQSVAASQGARLSLRKAWLAAMLLDHLPDRLWEAGQAENRLSPGGATDLPAYRATLRTRLPALAAIFDLTAMQPDSPRLELRSVAVPAESVSTLPVEDFMISLYNHNQIQQLLLTQPNGTRQPAHEALAEALRCLGEEVRVFGL